MDKFKSGRFGFFDAMQVKKELEAQKLRKKLLESENKELEKSDDSKNSIIKEFFAFTLRKDQRKHDYILSIEDYEKLIDWLSYYFDNNNEVPKISDPIQRIKTAKGNIVYTFKILYKEIYPSGTIPDNYYNLIKQIFRPYHDDNIENYKKTSKPQYYDDL